MLLVTKKEKLSRYEVRTGHVRLPSHLARTEDIFLGVKYPKCELTYDMKWRGDNAWSFNLHFNLNVIMRYGTEAMGAQVPVFR